MFRLARSGGALQWVTVEEKSNDGMDLKTPGRCIKRVRKLLAWHRTEWSKSRVRYYANDDYQLVDRLQILMRRLGSIHTGPSKRVAAPPKSTLTTHVQQYSFIEFNNLVGQCSGEI